MSSIQNSKTFNKKFNNINFLGHIPFNPDFLLDKQRFRDRPVGILYTDLIKMYWNVRSFKVNISITTVAPVDALTSFIMGGGTSAGVIGAIGGLANATQEMGRNSGGVFLKDQYTKIYNSYQKKIRIQKTTSSPFEGIDDGKLQDVGKNREKFEIDKTVKNPILFSNKRKPVEGDLCSAGPIHVLTTSNAFLQIDFSDIFYYQRKYWPKIIFTAAAGDSRYASSPLRVPGYDVPVRGSISLMNYVIPIYSDITFSPNRIIPPFAIANGAIIPGDRCCDRFFYDGFDAEREIECKNVCGDEPKGVYRKERTSVNNSTPTTSSTTRNFVGGGGQFGGGGASATF